MLTTTTTVKIFIDIFIGIWALVLAVDLGLQDRPQARREGPRRRHRRRFPQVRGRLFRPVSCLLLGVALAWPDFAERPEGCHGRERSVSRLLFFVMTFFTIGLGANFKKLWAEGIGRLALVYVLSLFGFIIWIGLAISWLFFHGVHPPTRAEALDMTEPKRSPETWRDSALAREMAAIPDEPLLPIEKKLIVGSLLVGPGAARDSCCG